MAAWWSRYFNQGKSVVDHCQACSASSYPESVLLQRTIDWLLGAGKEVTLITQVPTYDRDVPVALALASMGLASFPYSDIVHARRVQSEFTRELSPYVGHVRVLHPVDMLCTPTCKVEDAGQSWYRDSNHLSAEGSLALVPYFADNLHFPSHQDVPLDARLWPVATSQVPEREDKRK